MSAVVLKKPDQATMLDQLAQAVNLERAGPEAKAIHRRLKASIWTAEDKADGRKLGQLIQHEQSEDRKAKYRRVALQAIIDNYDSGNYLSRAGIIENIHSQCVVDGIKGRGGLETMQRRTIGRWLKVDVEHEIRLEAISKIEERARKGWGGDGEET